MGHDGVKVRHLRQAIAGLFIPALLGLSLAGCLRTPVGGHCEYDSHPVLAVVQVVADESMVVAYDGIYGFSSRPWVTETLPYRPWVSPGDILPAEATRLIRGTCSPGRLYLRDRDYLAVHNVVIPYSREGVPEPGGEARLAQARTAFAVLSRDYPLTLVVEGHSAASGEYGQNLARHYANRVISKWAEDLPAATMRGTVGMPGQGVLREGVLLRLEWSANAIESVRRLQREGAR